jgi:hypothetical protein
VLPDCTGYALIINCGIFGIFGQLLTTLHGVYKVTGKSQFYKRGGGACVCVKGGGGREASVVVGGLGGVVNMIFVLFSLMGWETVLFHFFNNYSPATVYFLQPLSSHL